MATTGVEVRSGELFAALSLALDLGTGERFEHALRTCLIALELADRLDLSADERRDVYHLALLHSIGCTADSPEAAARYGDDIRLRVEAAPADTGRRPEVVKLLWRASGRDFRRFTAVLAAGPKGAANGLRAHWRRCCHFPRRSSGMLLPVIMPRYLGGVAEDVSRMERPEALERRTRRMSAAGRKLSGRPLRRALEREPEIARRINAVFDNVDLMIAPTIAKSAPETGISDGHGAFRTFNDAPPWVAYSAVWNYTGQPAAALPAGLDDDGMPLSVQIVAKPSDERTLLALAAEIERAALVSPKPPPVSSGTGSGRSS